MVEGTAYCEVRPSDIAGLGTFAVRDLGAGQELFREAEFLVSRGRKHLTPPAADAEILPVQVETFSALSAITLQHKHCPPCVRLASTDTGGLLDGCVDTYWFARAYAASPMSTRAEVLELDAPCWDDSSHVIVDVVCAEAGVLRDLNPELRLIPIDEMERAIHRRACLNYNI